MVRAVAVRARILALATVLVLPGIVAMLPSQVSAGWTFASDAGREMLTPRAKAVLALVAVNVIWGTTFVAPKPVLERIPPHDCSARFASALLVLIPFLVLTRRRPVLTRMTTLIGFVGVFLVYTCRNLGLAFTAAFRP